MNDKKNKNFTTTRLSPGDPSPFKINNAGSKNKKWLLTCDHASNRVPYHMDNLSLSPKELSRHIAWDIGAMGMANEISRILDAPLVSGNYSRLIIDLNRPISSPTLIVDNADGTPILANTNVSHLEFSERVDYFHTPYHNKISSMLDLRVMDENVPILVAIHSFTPLLNNTNRPWHIGLLYEHDDRLVEPLKEAILSKNPELIIGDNEPYAIRGPSDYTIPFHGQDRGIPHIEIEVRQDLIETQEKQIIWGQRLASALISVVNSIPPMKIITPKT